MSTNKDIVIDTPEGIAYYRLASLKGQLKLESKGLKGTLSPLRPKLAEEFGLKPRDKYEKYIAVIQAKMDSMLKKPE